MAARITLTKFGHMLKKDIHPLQNSLQKIVQLIAYQYYRKDEIKDQLLQTCVIAQEVQKLFPEIVPTDSNMTRGKYLTFLINSIKETDINSSNI